LFDVVAVLASTIVYDRGVQPAAPRAKCNKTKWIFMPVQWCSPKIFGGVELYDFRRI